MPPAAYVDVLKVCQPRPAIPKGMLRVASMMVPCALGRSGIVRRKREGDGGTPAGSWSMRYVLYRPDRIRHILTGLPLMPMAPRDGWCDWPDDPRYNRPVRLPHPARAEVLWRDDGIYDILVVLGHNDDPPIAGRGSAIFFHLTTPDLAPTEGCVAVRRLDMLRLLRRCGPGTRLAIAG